MNNDSKKIVIPVVAGVVVIIVAIIIFVLIGKSSKGSKNIKNRISFNAVPEENVSNSSDENETDNNTTSNKTNTTTKKEFDDEFFNDYEEICKSFANACIDSDEIANFVDYIDAKAWLAYDNVDGDESKFMDEYQSISDDDPSIEQGRNMLMQLPDLLKILSFDSDSDTNSDINVEFVEITDIQQSKKLEDIRRVMVTYKVNDEEIETEFVFFQNILINMSNADNSSDSNSNSDESNQNTVDNNSTDDESDDNN